MPPRSHALLALFQSLVLGAAAWWIGIGWTAGGAIFGVVAALQLGAALALTLRRGGPLSKGSLALAAGASLLSWFLLLGMAAQVVTHLERSFGPSALEQGQALFGVVGLLSPWFLFIPIFQLISLRAWKTAAATAGSSLLALLLPAVLIGLAHRPLRGFAEVDGPKATSWLYTHLQGDPTPAPQGPGPVLLVASEVRAGALVASDSAEGATLGEALNALDLPPLEPGVAVVLEAALAERRLVTSPMLNAGPVVVAPGSAGLVGKDRVLGSLEVWRGKSPVNASPWPLLRAPALQLSRFKADQPRSWVELSSWMGSDAGVVPLQQTWAAPPPLTETALRDAALAGARFIVANQEDDGQYAYVVKGPSGELGKGYNIPRHAGATWFLARVARRTGDPEVARAAHKGLDYMWGLTQKVEDRGFVLDPERHDGKAWVGTTALAALAALEMGDVPEMASAWALHVASAVDERGQVRGDYNLRKNTWPAQNYVTYAQGQGQLALAVAARAGLPGTREPMERAARFTDDGHWPVAGGGSLFTLDEHWTCLSALVSSEVLGEPVAQQTCLAYLRLNDLDRAPLHGPVLPVAGAAGGHAEAVVARAEYERRQGKSGHWRDEALAYGEMLLSNLYQTADAPLVGHPRLLGGFRDRAWELDVRVDAVQHIGCALLGVEQLLAQAPLPGGMP